MKPKPNIKKNVNLRKMKAFISDVLYIGMIQKN